MKGQEKREFTLVQQYWRRCYDCNRLLLVHRWHPIAWNRSFEHPALFNPVCNKCLEKRRERRQAEKSSFLYLGCSWCSTPIHDITSVEMVKTGAFPGHFYMLCSACFSGVKNGRINVE